jgi:hypothetical protein
MKNLSIQITFLLHQLLNDEVSGNKEMTDHLLKNLPNLSKADINFIMSLRNLGMRGMEKEITEKLYNWFKRDTENMAEIIYDTLMDNTECEQFNLLKVHDPQLTIDEITFDYEYHITGERDKFKLTVDRIGKESHWEIGIDMGEEEGTQTVLKVDTKEQALEEAIKMLDNLMYKSYGIFIDEWVKNSEGDYDPQDKNIVLRKFDNRKIIKLDNSQLDYIERLIEYEVESLDDKTGLDQRTREQLETDIATLKDIEKQLK